MSIRVQRMIDSGPSYYQESVVHGVIQEAQGLAYDSVDEKNEDLRKQLYIMTATWGLKYWEACVGLPTNTADDYEIRRSRALSKWRGYGTLSVELIKNVCSAFMNGDVDVKLDTPAQQLDITFVGLKGVPPNLYELKVLVDDVVHAHLGVNYKITYNTLTYLKGFTAGLMGAFTCNELRTAKLEDGVTHERLENLTYGRLEGVLNGNDNY